MPLFDTSRRDEAGKNPHHEAAPTHDPPAIVADGGTARRVATPITDSDSDLRDLLAAIREKYPFRPTEDSVAGEDWARFKRAWKASEAALNLPRLRVLAPHIDTMVLAGGPRQPSKATVQYMKRRVRRFMRRLAESDPDAYVSIAAAVLRQPANGNEPLHTNTRWVAADVLYGGGTTGTSRSTRSERVPERFNTGSTASAGGTSTRSLGSTSRHSV